MADVPPQGPAAPSVQALLDALDARSRTQAEDAAGRLLGHALDRVGEALASIEQRLGTLEAKGDNAAVFTQVVELGARLERFEQAFYRAVSEGGDGSDVVRNIETVIRQGTGDYVKALESLRERQQAELEAMRATLEEVVRHETQAAAQTAGPAQAEPVDLTPLIVRLDEVSAKIQRPTTDAMRELAERLEAQLDRLHESFPRLNELRQSWNDELRPVADRLQAVEEAVGRTADVPANLPEVASRLEGAVERLAGLEGQLHERDAALGQLDGRMEGLESRVRAHLAGLTERVEGVMGAVAGIGQQPEGDLLGEVTAVLAALPDAFAAPEIPSADEIAKAVRAILPAPPAQTEVPSAEDIASAVRAALAGELAALREPAGSDPALEQLRNDIQALAAKEMPAVEIPRVEVPTADEIAERVVASLPAPAEPPAVPDIPSVEDMAAKVRDVLHREFELLTQRVAAMQSSLEATRTLLDQHVEDTAQSLGRRATEVGRKLAADLGFRPRKEERREPRGLNRGGH